MKSYKYILFDWDGCLAKTLDIWLWAYKKVIKDRGISLEHISDFQIVNKSFGKWEDGLANLGAKDAKRAYEESIELVISKFAKVSLYSGAAEILKKFDKKAKEMALLTSSYRSWIQKPLDYHNIRKYFRAFITKDDMIKGKPDPEIIFKAINLLRGKKESTIIIGDSYHDVRAGHNAGIKTVIFYPKENEKFYTLKELQKERPDYFIRDLSDLIEIVD